VGVLAPRAAAGQDDKGPLHARYPAQGLLDRPDDLAQLLGGLGSLRGRRTPYDGVGFVFCSADPLTGIDLDGCRDPESGEISPWADKIIADASEGYVEVSPSGTGVHIIVEGRVRDGGIRRGAIEMYSRDRFFTITGVLA
jgi:primase-polymerase (primpol)-like protein